MNRPNRVPRETTKSFTERKIPKDEQLEKAKNENKRIREKMLKLTSRKK